MAREIMEKAFKALLFVILLYLIFLFMSEGQQVFVYEGF